LVDLADLHSYTVAGGVFLPSVFGAGLLRLELSAWDDCAPSPGIYTQGLARIFDGGEGVLIQRGAAGFGGRWMAAGA
jgi:hypothetical protein